MLLGIDLGGMSAKAALVEGKNILKRAQVNTSASESAEETILRLASLCKECAEEAYESVEAIGVGAPGVINSGEGVVVAWSNFGWKNVSLCKILREKTGKRVFLLNDANAAALGEAKFGAGTKYGSSILITLGTGVGGGIVLGGKIFEGYKSAGGEIGHTVIRVGGRACSCGRRGCLECYVSTRALMGDVKRAALRHPESALSRIIEEEGLDGKTLFHALERGDEAAERVFANYIKNLGEGILNLANLFRPEAVFIGGGVSAQGEKLIRPLKEYVLKGLYLKDYAPLEIAAATLKNDAGILGAAEFARQKLFS